jgi:hypothetical protein
LRIADFGLRIEKRRRRGVVRDRCSIRNPQSTIRNTPMLTFAFILFVVITAASFAATLMPSEDGSGPFPLHPIEADE